MSQAPLAQSADKKELFARLGLNEQIHRLLLVGLLPGRSLCLLTLYRMTRRMQEIVSAGTRKI